MNSPEHIYGPIIRLGMNTVISETEEINFLSKGLYVVVMAKGSFPASF